MITILGCSSNRIIKSEHNPYIFREHLSRQDIGKHAKIICENETTWRGKIISLDEESICITRDKNNEEQTIPYDRIKKIVITDNDYNLAVVFAVVIGATIILVGGSYLIIK